jgi:hypothetical protein
MDASLTFVWSLAKLIEVKLKTAVKGAVVETAPGGEDNGKQVST